MQKVFTVAVDIGRKLPAPAFEVNTNDLKSVKLLITITNGQTLLDLTDATVRIAIRKPDNNIIFQDCTINDAKAGQVEIILENQAYIMAGTHTAEIMCYKGSEVVAVSGTFSYKSTKGIMNDEAVESKSEFTAINQKIEEAKKLLEDAAESGVGVDEQARQEIQEVTAALAGTAKKSDVAILQSEITNRATKQDIQQLSLTFKESYSTLAELEAKYPNPNGDNANHVVLADNMIYTYKNGWISTGIQANGTGVTDESITNKKIAPASIDESKLTFTTNSNNLFDGTYITGFALAVGSSPYTITASPDSVMIVIPVVGGKPYYIRQFDKTDRLRIAGTVNYPTLTNGAKVDFTYSYYDGADVPFSRVITPDASVRYLVLHVSATRQKPRIQITEKDSTKFIPYKVIKRDAIESKPLEKADLSEDVASAIMFGKYKPTWEIGEILVSDGITKDNNTRVRTGFIEAKKGSVLNFSSSTMSGVYVFRYDLNKKYISAIGYTDSYTVPEDCYIRLVSKYNDGKVITNTKDFYGKATLNMQASSSASVARPYLFGNFTEFYKSLPSDDLSAGMPFDLAKSTIDDVYNGYDEVMNDLPYNTTKKIRGYGTDINGNPDQSLPIYEYEINNPQDNGLGIKLNPSPVGLILTGIHGYEKSAVWSTLQFFKQLMNAWKTNDNLASIKSNMSFKVIPVLNPGGYNDNKRENRRNVDLNRNLSYRYNESTATNKGTAPYSELESIVVRDWLLENKNATIFIDYHNTSSTEMTYFNTPNVKMQNIYSSVLRRVSDVWRRDYLGDVDNMAYGFITNDRIPCTFNEGIYVAGIEHSATLEIHWAYKDVLYTKEVIETGVDLLANYLLAFLHHYNNGL